MRLEDTIDIQGPLQVRVSGHRIDIEIILGDYLEEGLSGEEVAWRYPTLTLEEVHSVLAYYWHHKADVDAYLQRVHESEDQFFAQQERNPSPAIRRLYQLVRKHRETYRVGS